MKKDRIAEIAELLDKRGKLTLEQLADYFPGVSQMTLRRDLLQLEKEGKIIRIRGGAMSVREVQKTSGEPYTKKTTIRTDEKIVIAQKAAGLIDEGASIFIDGGSTALYLAKEMPDRFCNVFTNGIAVATELAKKKNVIVNLLGGQLIKENLSTASSFSSLYFTDTNFEIAMYTTSQAKTFHVMRNFAVLALFKPHTAKLFTDVLKFQNSRLRPRNDRISL